MSFHLHTTATLHTVATPLTPRVTSPANGGLMPFAGKRSEMAQAWTLRACDPTRRTSLSPRHDRKREVDSKAEVSGT